MWGCCNDDHVFTYGAEMLCTDFNYMDSILPWSSQHLLAFLSLSHPVSFLRFDHSFDSKKHPIAACWHMLTQLNPGVDLGTCHAVSKDLHSSSPAARLGKPGGEFRVCSRVATSQLRCASALALLVLVWPLVTCWSPCFNVASLLCVMCCAGSYWLRYCAAGVDVLWMLA